jgi:hypothetical protein
MRRATTTIENLPAAFRMVKAMRSDGVDWGEGCRSTDRQTLQEIVEHQMRGAFDLDLEHLESAHE